MLRSESVKTVSNAAPTKRIGAIIGTITFRNRCMKVAPSTFAASMISGFTDVIPASRTIALNGKPPPDVAEHPRREGEPRPPEPHRPVGRPVVADEPELAQRPVDDAELRV